MALGGTDSVAAKRSVRRSMTTLFGGAKIVDLTHTLDASTIYWPTEDGFKLESEQHGLTEGGYYYAANKFCTAEHGGTHMDAPEHFSEHGLTADEVSVAAGIGPAAVVDVSAKAAADRDYRLTVADLDAWEAANGRLPDGAVLLLRTGWGRFWPDKERYLGTKVHGDVTNLHFPSFSKESAEWLTRERNVKAIGIDTASIDYGPSRDFVVHRIWTAANKPAFENLANLERLPATGATVIALPMKIGGGSGAPARVIAVVP